MRRGAEFYYQQLDALRMVRQEVRRELLAEGKKYQAWKRLCLIPSIGPIRSAVLLGILQTPHRFRTKRQLWTYSGFGIEAQSSADHRRVDGQRLAANADHPALWVMKPKKKSQGRLLIIVLHLEVQIVRMASA